MLFILACILLKAIVPCFGDTPTCGEIRKGLLQGKCARIIDGSTEVELNVNWSRISFSHHLMGEGHVNLTFRMALKVEEETILETATQSVDDTLLEDIDNIATPTRKSVKELLQEYDEERLLEEKRNETKSKKEENAVMVSFLDERGTPPSLNITYTRYNYETTDGFDSTLGQMGLTLSRRKMLGFSLTNMNGMISYSVEKRDPRHSTNLWQKFTDDANEVLIRKQPEFNVLIGCPSFCSYWTLGIRKKRGQRALLADISPPAPYLTFALALQTRVEGFSFQFVMEDHTTRQEIVFFKNSLQIFITNGSQEIWHDTVDIFEDRIEESCRYFAAYQDERFNSDDILAPFQTIGIRLLAAKRVDIFMLSDDSEETLTKTASFDFGNRLRELGVEQIYLISLSAKAPTDKVPENASLIYAFHPTTAVLKPSKGHAYTNLDPCNVYATEENRRHFGLELDVRRSAVMNINSSFERSVANNIEEPDEEYFDPYWKPAIAKGSKGTVEQFNVVVYMLVAIFAIFRK